MKLTVIGRGNAGCLSALHFAHYTNAEIELVYDGKTPTEYVGQASVLELPELLWATLDVDLYNNPFHATIKSGILYENWGKQQEKIFHEFTFGSYGIHYDTRLMQDFILDRLSSRIKIEDRRINSYEEIDSDYIIDCSGFTKEHKGGNLGDEYTELVNPLNSVLLSNVDEIRKHHWTRAVATPDGWCFVIPLHDTVSLGYLYNSDITGRNVAEENFKELFDIDSIRDDFSFQCFLAKNPIQDDRIVLNGNRLFFLEPLESTAVQTYIYWNRMVFDWMTTRSKPSSILNEHIKNYTRGTQNFILWHYLNGSKYDTPFWDYAKTLNIDDPDFFNFLHLSRTNDHSESPYAQWHYKSFRTWENGISNRIKLNG